MVLTKPISRGMLSLHTGRVLAVSCTEQTHVGQGNWLENANVCMKDISLKLYLKLICVHLENTAN